jgi:dTDP-4-amino-4,6-dideoxy-D-galactose acyltransferase
MHSRGTEEQDQFILLPWDSEHFGFPIGRVVPARLSSDLSAAAIEWAKQNKVSCLYFLADPKDPQLLSLAGEWGFEFVDARMTLQLDTLAGRIEAGPRTVEIAVATGGDLPMLEEIASNAHRETRFFLDSRFPTKKVADLYREWIRRDVLAGRVLIATGNGSCLGYVSLSMAAGDDGACISLIAVSESARGRGVGGAMLEAALELAKNCGMSRVTVVTQAANVSALRLYQSAGFRSSSCEYWFHRWLK